METLFSTCGGEKESHRAILVLQTEASHEMDHDEAMAVIWRFLNPNKYWHKQEMKPYVWNVQKTGEGVFQFIFSSIQKADVKRFVEAAQEKIPAFRMKDGTIYNILHVQYLPDFDLSSNFVRVFSCGGCQCFRKKGVGMRKRVWQMISATEAPEKFVERIENSIRRRARCFLPDAKGIEEAPIRVRFVESTAPTRTVSYKGCKIRTQFVTFKLEAPPEIQAVALYGGIGKEPSSGFGLVLPV